MIEIPLHGRVGSCFHHTDPATAVTNAQQLFRRVVGAPRRDPRRRSCGAKQDQHHGDRWRLFAAVAKAIDVEVVFYPGSYVDIAPSFVFPSVTYLDTDRRTPGFFADTEGVLLVSGRRSLCTVVPNRGARCGHPPPLASRVRPRWRQIGLSYRCDVSARVGR